MMSFVVAMEESCNVLNFIVVNSIISVAMNLGLYVVCESTLFVMNYQLVLSSVCDELTAWIIASR